MSTGVDASMVYDTNCIVQIGKRDWERIEAFTYFLSTFSFLKSQGFIWNVFDDYGRTLFSFILKNTFLWAYFLLFSCNTFHATLCKIAMVC